MYNSARPTGLEPATSRVTGECSNQIELRPHCVESYQSKANKTTLVSMGGVEPPFEAYESSVLTIELHRHIFNLPYKDLQIHK